MTAIPFGFTGVRHRRDRHFACIRTATGVAVLAEAINPAVALLYGKAEARKRIALGNGQDIISVEVLNSDGDVVLGEMAEDLCAETSGVTRQVMW